MESANSFLEKLNGKLEQLTGIFDKLFAMEGNGSSEPNSRNVKGGTQYVS
jgi:hypothetical protein